MGITFIVYHGMPLHAQRAFNTPRHHLRKGSALCMELNALATPFIDALYSCLSRDRLEAHRSHGGSDFEMAVNYLYNAILSESLYTSLGFLEVTLRNTLHTTLANFYDTPNWYDRSDVLERYQADDVARAKRRIEGIGKEVVPGRVVAELGFGFWVSLLSGPYDRRLWWPHNAQLLKAAFPHIPSRLRQRKTIYYRYNSLRELRNRVMHYEPIWNRPTLYEDHQHIYEAIGWISPAAVAASGLVDRFPTILATGHAQVEILLNRSLGIE